MTARRWQASQPASQLASYRASVWKWVGTRPGIAACRSGRRCHV